MVAVPERFSPEWIAALDAAARSLPGAGDPFVIQQVVTDPDGEVAWHVDLGRRGRAGPSGTGRRP